MKSKNGNYIACVVIFIVCLIGAILLIMSVKNNNKGRPMVYTPVDTTTTTTLPVDDLVFEITPFQRSLSDIIYGNYFYDNYDEIVNYGGLKFRLICNSFSVDDNKCLEGSGSVYLGTNKIELYTFDSESTDYVANASSYYIFAEADRLILFAGGKNGFMKVYNKNGELIDSEENVTTSYIENGKVVSKVYPLLTENELTYYSCNNNKVSVKKLTIGDKSSRKIVSNLSDVTCN